MSQIEFLKYEPVQGEKHFGIATVRLYGKVVLRYKIVPNRDGTGYFPCAASYKMPATADEAERFVPSFVIDSNYDKDEIETLIKARVKPYLTQGTAEYESTQPDGFKSVNSGSYQYAPQQTQQPAPQNTQNQGGYPQQGYSQPQHQAQPLPGFENVQPKASWPPNNDGMPF